MLNILESTEAFQKLFARIDEASLIIKNGMYIDCNAAALSLTGYPDKSILINSRPEDTSPKFQPDGACSIKKAGHMSALAFEKGQHHFEWERMRYDGTSLILDVSLTPIMLGGEEHMHVLWRDRSGKISKRQTDSMQQFIDNMGDAHLILQNDTYVECNQAAVDLLGYPDKKELLYKGRDNFYPLLQPDGSNSVEKAREIIDRTRQEGSHAFEWTYKKFDGTHIRVALMMTFAIVDGQELLHIVWRDLTPILAAQSDSIKELLGKIGDANLLIKDNLYVDCNKAAVDLLGYPDKQSLLNIQPAIISPTADVAEQRSFDIAGELMKMDSLESSQYFEWTHLKYDGSPVVVEVMLTPVSIHNEDMIHVVFRDLTEVKKQEEALSNLAHYDALTGLPNRVLFADRFDLAIAHSKRTKTQLAVCFLDLDNFKPINDGYGHSVGDELLRQVATRISAAIRDEDTVSRQGGDEFALLLGELGSYQQCVKLINRVLHALAEPFLIGENIHFIGASCGVTLYPVDDNDIDILLRHADHAMYDAKISGKNRFAFFDAGTELLSKEHTHFLAEVSQAIEGNEFVLFYQPKVNMGTGEMFGAEALIRWQKPDKELLLPVNFLPAIENSQIMVDLGKWVINAALCQLEQWCKEGKRWVVSINIDAYHLMQENFFDDLKQALEKYSHVPAKLLEIEILETIEFNDVDKVSKLIDRCQTLGVSFALDDFGTGYSSLTYLKRLPVQWLKIDRNFVRNILNDEEDLAIVEGIISLAKAFKRNVIAEGVESIEHGTALLALGCYNAQGYGIAKPMPADSIVNWDNNSQPEKIWAQHVDLDLIEDEL